VSALRDYVRRGGLVAMPSAHHCGLSDRGGRVRVPHSRPGIMRHSDVRGPSANTALARSSRKPRSYLGEDDIVRLDDVYGRG